MTILAYSLSILGMIVLPAALAAALRRRLRAPWLLFLCGCATFAVSQAVHLPLNKWLGHLGLISSMPVGSLLWRTALFAGLTAGLCEELARAAGYALLRRARGLPSALMLGLGHGGLEAMVIGGVQTAAGVTSLLALRGADLASMGLSPAQAAAATQQLANVMHQPWLALLPLIERALAIGLHVTFSVMVSLAFSRRNGWWVVAAVAAHALVDMVAVLLAYNAVNAWLIEAALLVATAPGLVWVARLLRREVHATPPRTAPSYSGWQLFRVALRKEWLELRRTRRLLVIVVVFALFGMTSPLLAHFTPEILKLVPGAEQFAGLVPIPTAADAVAQFVKNLTQFGFVLAILFGMSAVAGEVERGTAAMALSKPLPRTTYILAKLVAQSGAYAAAMLLGGLGGYYYTWVLFGSISLGGFSLITLLLLAWLLVFVAVTLLASSLARSTGVSAGIALGLAVLFLLLGGLPTVGTLAPAGLVAWASSVSLASGASSPNGGALAMAAVLVELCLLGALGAFEHREL